LPKTFQDAVRFAREFGVQYLWIDSLCIIQNDPEDWAREAARMTEVYESGLFTIAADAGDSSSAGLLHTDEGRRVTICVLKAPGLRYAGTMVDVYVRADGEKMINDVAHHNIVDAIADSTNHRERSRLSRRAWVMQERLLSPRTLHFTAAELAWECNEQVRCECRVAEETALALAITFQHSYVDRSDDGYLRHFWLQTVEDSQGEA